MTTNTYSHTLSHASDADFRAWGLALSNALTAAGLAVAGDTGQINWATVTRPAINTAGGYEVRYLNDPLHATKPCYIKIEFGTGSTATYPNIWITVASATNGAGAVAGTTYFARIGVCQSGAPAALSTPTFVCVKDGYVGVAFQRRGITSTGLGYAFFALCRTTDTAGVISSAGFYLYHLQVGGGTNNYGLRRSYVAAEVADASGYCLFPGAATSTLVGADAQAMRHFGYQPTVICNPFLLSYLDSELASEGTFTATPLGATSRTFLTLGGSEGPLGCGMGAGVAVAAARLAMQYD